MQSDNLVQRFGATATSLAKNPLGIIALFIVLVYGFAALVTAFSGNLSPAERVPLVYFLIVFPLIVLGVFTWLVSNHSGKLFAPSDFKDERNFLEAQQNYVKKQLSAAASLSAATVKADGAHSEAAIRNIAKIVSEVRPPRNGDDSSWRNHILWVDDRPDNNIYERSAFEAIGLKFTLKESTSDALEIARHTKFAAIISDMGRREGPREGYALLDQLRAEGNDTPLFFYASSRKPEHVKETREHGGQGCTNDAQELFQMVTRAVIGSRLSP